MRELVVRPPILTSYQKAIIDSPARFKTVKACTKSGKTFGQIWDKYRKAHLPERKAGDNIWWVAPVYSQAEIAFGRLARLLHKSGVYKIRTDKLTITAPAGTVITFKSAEKPDNLYGDDVVDATFDEFTRAREEAWHALRSTLSSTGGGCTFIGNYTGENSWGNRMIQDAQRRGDPDYAHFKITAVDAVKAGRLTQAEVDQARRDLPHAVFMALYMCEGVSDPSMLIEYGAIQDLWTNEGVPEGDKFITADVARYGSDRTTIGLWSGFRLQQITVTDHQPTNATAGLLREIATREGVGMSMVIVDEDGVGGGVVDLLPGCRGFHGGAKAEAYGQVVNYANLKAQCYFELARKINERGIFIQQQEHREVIEQELYQVRNGGMDTDGKLKVEKKAIVKGALGRSPDLADMMMMRMAATLRPESIMADVFAARANEFDPEPEPFDL